MEKDNGGGTPPSIGQNFFFFFLFFFFFSLYVARFGKKNAKELAEVKSTVWTVDVVPRRASPRFPLGVEISRRGL